MAGITGKPAYLQLADELRARMSDGRLREGDMLPSTRELMSEFAVSSTVVKNAINELRRHDLVVGQQGKGVFVQNTDGAADEAPVERRVTELAEEVRRLSQRVESLESKRR